MKTYHLDATKIDPNADPAGCLCEFYGIEKQDLFSLRRTLFASEENRLTEVFNWPVDTPNWKAIADQLESIQQHSPSFYVIWGPETDNAIVFDQKRLEENPPASSKKKAAPDQKQKTQD